MCAQRGSIHSVMWCIKDVVCGVAVPGRLLQPVRQSAMENIGRIASFLYFGDELNARRARVGSALCVSKEVVQDNGDGNMGERREERVVHYTH